MYKRQDREDGGIPNPHFHVLCPIRPIKQDGKWGLKQRRVYELDEDGNRIRDADGKFVFNAVPTTDWGSPETLEDWRQTWAELCNAKFCLLYTSNFVGRFVPPAFGEVELTPEELEEIRKREARKDRLCLLYTSRCV